MDYEKILNQVAEYEPELVEKTAQVIALSEKFAPEFTSSIFEDFETIFSVLEEKTAASGGVVLDTAKRVGVALGSTVAAGLMGALATDLYDAARRGLSKSRNFKRIMDANPNLKKEIEPKRLTMAFNAIHRYAPDFTADPIIGGVLVRNLAEVPEMSFKTVSDVLKAQSDFNSAKTKHFGEIAKMGPVLKGDMDDFKKKEIFKARLREAQDEAKEYKKNQGERSPFRGP